MRFHHVIFYQGGFRLAEKVCVKSNNDQKPSKQKLNYMDVSKKKGWAPQIIHFNRVFHYKPSILGYQMVPVFFGNTHIITKNRHIPKVSSHISGKAVLHKSVFGRGSK